MRGGRPGKRPRLGRQRHGAYRFVDRAGSGQMTRIQDELGCAPQSELRHWREWRQHRAVALPRTSKGEMSLKRSRVANESGTYAFRLDLGGQR